MPPTVSATALPKAPPRVRHWVYFLLTTVIAMVMLIGMTVTYGLRELRESAHDMAGSLVEGVDAKKPPPVRTLAEQGAARFRDADHVEICLDGVCGQAGEQRASFAGALMEHFELPCAQAAASLGSRALTASVCLSSQALVEDIARDILVLGTAQLIGFGIWFSAIRRFAARSKRWNAKLAHAASTDALTGLLNRGAFSNVVDDAVTAGGQRWLLLMGIDGLKAINEFHGHAAGDRVIATVAERLRALPGTEGLLARTGGDEFGLLADGERAVDLQRHVRALRVALADPIDFDGLALAVSLSIGAVAPRAACTGREAFRRASVALKASKRGGGNGVSIFDEAYDLKLRKAHQLRVDLRSALRKGEIQVHYQPLMDRRGRVYAAEALARWVHPDLGPIPPDEFIPLAETSGVIHELGEQVLAQACRDLRTARIGGLGLRKIAVNLSAAQLSDRDLANRLSRVVREAGLMTADVELELTESAAMNQRQEAEDRLRELSNAGFDIAIDDFGTGYSSLSRLQTMPFRKLKIDKSFVGAYNTEAGAALLEATLEMAHRLRLNCVAEGVETPEQFAWLASRGCELFQGWHFGKPMLLDDLIQLAERRPVPAAPTGLGGLTNFGGLGSVVAGPRVAAH